MPDKITAKEQNLIKVFSDDYVFEVPLYQRPYAWTTEQVDELVNDLTDAMGRDAEAPYFLGSVVLIKSEDDAKSQIVDGQQRLTTLTMLICVLRDICTDSKTSGELDDFVREVGSELKKTEDRFRLTLRSRDSDFFRSYVQERGNISKLLQRDPATFSDSQGQIRENVKHLHHILSQYDEDHRRRLANYVCQNCFLVVVSVSDADAAYRIFAVLNSRGLSLYPTDILKAEIIGEMSPTSQERYTGQWENIEEQLGRDEFRDLFAHIRTIYSKDKLRTSLQKGFKEQVLNRVGGGGATEFFEEILQPYAQVYDTVSRTGYESVEDPEPINSRLRYLRRLDNFDWIPPAMSYFHRRGDSRECLSQFLADLERLSYGLFILRTRVNDRINRYSRVLRSIEENDDPSDPDGPLQLSQAEKDDILARLNGDIYSQERVRLPLLLRLDALVADVGAEYQHPVISVEHVLPQNPEENSQWTEWFPDPEERHAWTHRLANLVLLSRRKNTRASNFDFARKKEEYLHQNNTTTFALTTQVVAETEWTLPVLQRRQTALIDALKQEWRLA